MNFHAIPKTVLLGRLSRAKAEHKRLQLALKELVDATEDRRLIPPDQDRAAATARVIRAYAACRNLMRPVAVKKIQQRELTEQGELWVTT